ncbi:signal peptidase II [bacterium]|nr:MAG: signal peptidase II [bacterium]
MKGFRLFLLLFVLGVAIDQIVKEWVRQSIPQGGSMRGLPIPNVFELTLTYNKGIAFGLFQGAGVFMTPVAVGIAAGAGWYSYKHPRETDWMHAAMGLLAAGAIGNLYDRLFHQRVTDMFWFRGIEIGGNRYAEFAVFNIADACITVATIMLMIVWWRDAVRQKNEPAVAPTPSEVREPEAS